MAIPILEVSDVTCTHQGVTLLKSVNFSLQKGENLVIFGPEGCGMSSLSELIINVNTDYEGDILYKGESLNSFLKNSIRK